MGKSIVMIRNVTKEKIKEAMSDIGDNKAPGPDGYTLVFFKRSWNVVGDEVWLAIQEFFNSGKLIGQLKSTLITLVPNVKQPQKVSQYRQLL